MIMRKKISFKNECVLHRLTQKYLKKLFNLKPLASEKQLHRKRPDALAVDLNTNEFVIIEYKNKYDTNVLNQVQKYYDLILNDKDFKQDLENSENIDFDNTRIMIISPKFSDDQIKDSKDNVELWQVSLFDNCEVTYENLKTGEVKKLKIKPEELKLTKETVLQNKSEIVHEIYNNLENRLVSEFSDLKIRYCIDMVSFRVNGNLICKV